MSSSFNRLLALIILFLAIVLPVYAFYAFTKLIYPQLVLIDIYTEIQSISLNVLLNTLLAAAAIVLIVGFKHSKKKKISKTCYFFIIFAFLTIYVTACSVITKSYYFLGNPEWIAECFQVILSKNYLYLFACIGLLLCTAAYRLLGNIYKDANSDMS